MERIIAAAIHQGQLILSLPSPARHGTIMKHAVEDLGLPKPITGTQGFLTSSGRFVGRREAVHIANTARQTRNPIEEPELFSEDLW